jgi:hypothetical protein
MQYGNLLKTFSSTQAQFIVLLVTPHMMSHFNLSHPPFCSTHFLCELELGLVHFVAVLFAGVFLFLA